MVGFGRRVIVRSTLKTSTGDPCIGGVTGPPVVTLGIIGITCPCPDVRVAKLRSAL
jgi:hypothetical protein